MMMGLWKGIPLNTEKYKVVPCSVMLRNRGLVSLGPNRHGGSPRSPRCLRRQISPIFVVSVKFIIVMILAIIPSTKTSYSIDPTALFSRCHPGTIYTTVASLGIDVMSSPLLYAGNGFMQCWAINSVWLGHGLARNDKALYH